MTTQTEALKLALEALITASGHVNNEAFVKVMMARDSVVEALAQPERGPTCKQSLQVDHEPVAWTDGPHLVMRTDWRDRANYKGPCVDIGRAIPDSWVPVLYTTPPQRKPQLTARLVSYPESNGKKNWTAMFVRTQPWDGLQGNAGGITIDRGECWNRVAYNAERARFLLGERTTEPSILEYGNDVKTPEEWDGTDHEAANGIHAAKQLKGDAA